MSVYRKLTGHELARAIIEKHGRDRYPLAIDQAAKVAGEVGELIEAILKFRDSCQHTDHDGGTAEGCPGCFPDPALEAAMAREYGDAGLALFRLGDKLGLDLEKCMADVVQNETRSFR